MSLETLRDHVPVTGTLLGVALWKGEWWGVMGSDGRPRSPTFFTTLAAQLWKQWYQSISWSVCWANTLVQSETSQQLMDGWTLPQTRSKEQVDLFPPAVLTLKAQLWDNEHCCACYCWRCYLCDIYLHRFSSWPLTWASLPRTSWCLPRRSPSLLLWWWWQ